jgi:serine phosphatase RsbU (regulator of sigma subunit)
VATRLLNAIVNESRIFEPRKILTELDERFRKTLKQDRTENDDGMDLCLCRIERHKDLPASGRKGTVEVCFSGARRPLFYTGNGQEIIRLQGNRKPVGGRYHQEITFTDETLVLDSSSILYLTTDGLADQHSPEREKFGNKRLVQALSSCRHLSMEEQKRMLDEELLSFQKFEKQRDDITVMGIRL